MTTIAEPTTLEEAADTLSMAWLLTELQRAPATPELWRAVVTSTALLAVSIPLGSLSGHDVADVLVWGFNPKKARDVRRFFDACMAARDAGTLAGNAPPAPAASSPRRI